MNIELLKTRQTKFAGYITVYVAIIITAVVVLNVLANRYNKSYDGTANKRYSLSDQTRKIVRELSQDATITYFDQSTRYGQAKDLLDQYANLSARIHVEYVDPDKNPEVARAAGIKNYGTAVVAIGARKEEAKSLTEEGITGAFIRNLKDKSRIVCFVTGSGEHQIENSDRNGYSRLKELLGKDEYEAKSINLLQKAEVPGDCTVVVVGGPTSDYQQPEVDAIKKFVEDGGRALLMLDAPLKMGTSVIADNEPLAKQLQNWGVILNEDLILELNPIGQLAGLGPQVALVMQYDSHAIVNEMKGSATGFPLSRSMEIKNGEKTTVAKIFSSSETSVATTNLSSPEVDTSDPKNKKGPLTLAAAGSYSTGKENSEGRFVVVGSSSWAANSFIDFNGNRDLALNAMNWLSSDEDLISIRPKAEDDRRITLTQSQFSWVRATSQFLLPLVVIVAGVSVWWRRR
ncbi:MAG TPA: GldG family protein [Pyrinomonadaceae bacterium]|nr:GldG family protein [Pyrinomonadaceae bacterium]